MLTDLFFENPLDALALSISGDDMEALEILLEVVMSKPPLETIVLFNGLMAQDIIGERVVATHNDIGITNVKIIEIDQQSNVVELPAQKVA